MTRITTVIAFTAAACTSALASGQATPPGHGDHIVRIAAEAGQFKTLLAAAKAAGLAGTLAGKGPFTVFAPTDAAFAALGDETIAGLLEPASKDRLAAILKYHVVSGRHLAADVVRQKELRTLQGDALPVAAGESGVTIGGAKVVKTDLVGSNGVIHVIDSVLLPDLRPNLVEAANAAGKFATLLAAAKAAGLAETLASGGPFTVFAPTDAAFAALGKQTIEELLLPENKARLAAILKHHVVAGSVPSSQAVKLNQASTIGGGTLGLEFDGKVLRVGGARVIAADVEARNGVIHVIDSVLLPQG